MESLIFTFIYLYTFQIFLNKKKLSYNLKYFEYLLHIWLYIVLTSQTWPYTLDKGAKAHPGIESSYIASANCYVTFT